MTRPSRSLVRSFAARLAGPLLVALSCAAAGCDGDRPYTLHVPPTLDPAKPAPLLLMLHGYASSGAGTEEWLRFTPVSDRENFLFAFADGTRDGLGLRYWNASDACCRFVGPDVDDVDYLRSVIDRISLEHLVDPDRVFVFGHSNGGFMTHRVACDLSSRVAAVVSLAGAGWLDASRCQPDHDVSVLQIHGDADGVISYTGGSTGLKAPYPSARKTVTDWSARERCDGTTSMLPPVDVAAEIDGDETTRERFEGCQGGDVELWTIQGAPHEPKLADDFASRAWSWLAAHPRHRD